MATAKGNKIILPLALNVPECPVCSKRMTVPIFQCKSGHSLCNICTTSLALPFCPICRLAMTHIRNLQLEEMIMKVKLPCPNMVNGCRYNMSPGSQEHVKECIYRIMDCPLGAVFGRCSWKGKLSEIQDHFEQCHPQHCKHNFDEDVIFQNMSINNDTRIFLLVPQGNLMFIITMEINTQRKMAYWTMQHIGHKNGAKQFIYEIHMTSLLDATRKAVFVDHCFNDVIKTDEIFRIGKCAMLPLNVLAHFVKDNKMRFRFLVKKIAPPSLKGITVGAVGKGVVNSQSSLGTPELGPNESQT